MVAFPSDASRYLWICAIALFIPMAFFKMDELMRVPVTPGDRDTHISDVAKSWIKEIDGWCVLSAEQDKLDARQQFIKLKKFIEHIMEIVRLAEDQASRFDKALLNERVRVLNEAGKLKDALSCASCTCHPPIEFKCPRCVALIRWDCFKKELLGGE